MTPIFELLSKKEVHAENLSRATRKSKLKENEREREREPVGKVERCRVACLVFTDFGRGWRDLPSHEINRLGTLLQKVRGIQPKFIIIS